jgi:hypothetical protein
MAEYFIHSRCCIEHWDLHYKDGKYELICAKCKKPVGSAIQISGPIYGDNECEECKLGTCKGGHNGKRT